MEAFPPPPGAFALPPALNLTELFAQQASAQRKAPPARKGAPWTDDEHKGFLAGLKLYGRGQWKQISRFYVPSRTPTQVASHAQKHFLRVSGAQKRRSRFTHVEEAAELAPLAPPPSAPLGALHALQPGLQPGLPPGLAPGYASPGLGSAGATGVPALFAQLPAAAPAHQAYALAPPLPRLAGAPGSVVGGVAMGVPIGVLPPLPSITTASGSELPILPVMPGRINALSASAMPPAPLPSSTLATTSFSADSGSEAGGSGSASPAPDSAPLHLRSRAAALAGRAAYTPSGRTQQLFQLLEQSELRQHAQQASMGAGAAAGQAGAAAIKRSSSATAALDALALLAEAESADAAPPSADPHPSLMVSAF